MSEKPKKPRISITVPNPLLADLDNIVEEGYYLSRGEIILDAIRHFLEDYYYLKSFMALEQPEEPR